MLSTENLSVQLYTVREALADDVDATLARIAAAGYRLVEPFGFPRGLDELRAGLTAHGLSAPTTHAHLVGTDDVEQTLAAARELGIETVIDPHIDNDRWNSAEDIAGIAADLNALAEQAAGHGLSVGYHNHAFELSTMIDGRHALEVLADSLDPAVKLEVDTYWALVGGADVPALLQRLGERVFALHLKDGDGSSDDKMQVAIGTGIVPVWDYVDATPGLAYGVVELDDSQGDRFVAVEESFRYLTNRTNRGDTQ